MSNSTKKYADLIFPDEKKVNAEAKEEAIENAQNEVTNAIHGATKAVRTLGKAVVSAQRAVPFLPAAVISAQFDLAAGEESLKALKEMQKSMFA